MARIRSLKPEFFMSESVGAVSFAARLLFAGLWTLADREGRLAWKPKTIKAQIFPHDDGLLLAPLAEELVHAGADGLLRFYEIDGRTYACIPGFSEHQRPHPKEPPSTFPECPKGHDPRWLPWKETASRVSPGSIPSAPVGREGNGREGDLGREGDHRGHARQPIALAGSLPRDHMDHAFCGARFCVSAKNLRDMVARYGEGGDEAVATWLKTTHDGLGPSEAAGGPLWLIKRFDAHLSGIGRLVEPAPAQAAKAPIGGTREQRLAAVQRLGGRS